MLVNIKSLSAKELYELAQKKEQDEAKLDALRQHISEKEAQREQILSKQRGDLANIDKQIKELSLRRKYMMEKHAQVANLLDEGVSILKAKYQALKEANEKQNAGQEEVPAVEETNSVPAKDSAAPASEQTDVETRLAKAIIGSFKGRKHISEGLLKEKLTGQGFAHQPINTVLSAMLKQKSLLRIGGGNYALGTIPAALR